MLCKEGFYIYFLYGLQPMYYLLGYADIFNNKKKQKKNLFYLFFDRNSVESFP